MQQTVALHNGILKLGLNHSCVQINKVCVLYEGFHYTLTLVPTCQKGTTIGVVLASAIMRPTPGGETKQTVKP